MDLQLPYSPVVTDELSQASSINDINIALYNCIDAKVSVSHAILIITLFFSDVHIN